MSKEFDDFIQSIHQINGICISCDEEKLTHNICMDCIINTNKVISDEEIYKSSFDNPSPIWHDGFLAGAKWYREQLNKSKQ